MDKLRTICIQFDRSLDMILVMRPFPNESLVYLQVKMMLLRLKAGPGTALTHFSN